TQPSARTIRRFSLGRNRLTEKPDPWNRMRPPGCPGGRRSARDSLSARGADRLLELLEELVEAVVAILDAIAHARLDHRVAVGHGLEHGVALDPAPPAAQILDHELVQGDVARDALELEGLDQVVDIHAVEHAVEAELAVRVPM